MAKLICPDSDGCVVMECESTVIEDYENEGITVKMSYNAAEEIENNLNEKIRERELQGIGLDFNDIAEAFLEQSICLTGWEDV